MNNDWGWLVTVLAEKLSPVYIVPRAHGCHDLPHVTRMVAMADEICDLIGGVDKCFFKITVWLHNADRIPEFQKDIKTWGLESFLRAMLPYSFPASITDEIIDAVLKHSKKDDEPQDSPLLLALRVADKWDRIGILGAVSGFEWLGSRLPSYDQQKPYGYGNTAEGHYKTIYQNLFRILEWYGMSSHVRSLVERHPWKMEHLLSFILAYGREVAEAHKIPNTSEEDIRKALGTYYEKWAPKS